MPAACIAGVATCSPGTVITSPTTIRNHITANRTQPWRTLPTILPNVKTWRPADPQDGEHLDEVGDRRGVLERVRRVHIEEAAAVRAELLDSDLAGDGAAGEDLLKPWIPVTDAELLSVWVTPWLIRTIPSRIAIGSRM